jgi:hypothetical protein
MNEHYLHFLWKNKRLPLHLLKTTEGKEVRIRHIGFYNTGSGPDFFNGKIELDGVVHSGNIEMHVKSSDWYAHGHQHDDAYNNVILHVVYEHDKLVFVEGIPLPTVELKELIDHAHYEKTMRMTVVKDPIPCHRQLAGCEDVIFWHQVERAAFRRMLRKGKDLEEAAANLGGDPRKVLFYAIAGAFGMRTNQLPFQELARRLPFERMLRTQSGELEAIVFGTGGFLDRAPADNFQQTLQQSWTYQKAKLRIHSSALHSWQFKGCRPKGFPTLRVAQLASFIGRMDWSQAFWELPSAEIKLRMEENLLAGPSDYWDSHYDFGKIKRKPSEGKMSLAAAHVVMTNASVPFLNWLAGKTSASIYHEKALELLELLPPEKNAVIDEWKNLGRVAKSAAESQGLLELKNEFCNRKQCLNCEIGNFLLKR